MIKSIMDDNVGNKAKITSVFKGCLNVLRDNEGLTGEKALRTMSYLLILKLLEPRFGSEINIDEYEYDFSHIEDCMVEQHKKKLLEIVRFSNLAKEKDDNLNTVMGYLWEDILSNHPTTKNIFLKGKGFDIERKTTYKKLIDKLNTVDQLKMDYDILGNAYEEVIQDIMTGKVLGQFFTQPLVKKLMVKLINPKMHKDGKIDTCGDPTMGTGGFLITYLQYVLEQGKEKGIEPDWEFIKNEGLYGKELEPDTYQLAVSNMLISSGHMFNGLERGDSIREPIIRKFDNILANPPFGIKGLKYDDFNNPLKFEYIPIKTDNAVSLFVQAIIYMLKINGKCAVVLPEGQDLFSKTNATLVAVREFLVKTCDLKKIIYLPSGIFTYTSIKTCIFYFIKKVEGKDALKMRITETRTKKTMGREYTFVKECQTKEVNFYEYNVDTGKRKLLVTVPMEKIENNCYSLNYAEYMEEKKEEFGDGILVKTLGEVCDFKNGKGIKRDALVAGEYPVVGGGTNPIGYHNEYNAEENTILCSSSGTAGFISRYNKKVWKSDCFSIVPKNAELVNNTYLYYYLKTIQDNIYKLKTGLAQPHIYSRDLQKIKIPIPPLENQNQIVEYLDFIYEKANRTSYEKIEELKSLNEYCLNMQKIFGDNIVKTLAKIVTYKSGKRLPKGHSIKNDKTPYPYIRIKDMDENTISLNDIKYITKETKDIINKYIITTDDIYISIVGTTGLVGIIPEELNGSNLTENAVRINIINKDEILQKYLMYDIQYNQQKELKSKTIGVAVPKLSIERLMTLKIPIPSLENQKKIVDYCEYNDALIKPQHKYSLMLYIEHIQYKQSLVCSKMLKY